MSPRSESQEHAPCADRNCDPSKGDDGCMAAIANEGAHDGLDGVWISAWDSCPLMAAAEAQRRALDAEDAAWEAWVETLPHVEAARNYLVGGHGLPDSRKFTEAECHVAGALSTMPPFDQQHPAACLPYARRALEALSEWEPTDV